jgi:post-segregation antitoxin (ccd killing protein)
LGKYVTISVKVPIELKEKIKKLGIKPSNLLRKAIEEEVRSREVERIKGEIEELKPLLSKISIEDATKSIREDREQR